MGVPCKTASNEIKMYLKCLLLLGISSSAFTQKFDGSQIKKKFSDPNWSVSNDLKLEFLAGAAAKGFENHESRISKNERRMEEMQILIDKLQTLIASGSSPETEAEELDLTKLSPSLGLLITGGAPERSPMEQITKNEIYIPSKNCSCKFTDWPTKDDGLQAAHTSGGKGFMSCGGMNVEEKKVSTCINYVNGKWQYQNLLGDQRIYHTTWNRNGELYLFGGYYSDTWRGDKVSWGSRAEKFPLQHPTQSACAIPDDENDQVYITGGKSLDTQTIVSIYGPYSYKGDLDAEMNIGRSEHGCAGYYENNKLVLVVAGGISERCKSNEFCNDIGWTSSPEMYKIGDPLWRLVAKLDNWIQKPNAVTLDNTIFMTGGEGPWKTWNRKEILVFHNEEWVEVAEMMYPRIYHDVAVVELNDDIMKDCDDECRS